MKNANDGGSELARQGRALYDEHVRTGVDEDAHRGEFVAIDTGTGAFEIGSDKLGVMSRLEERTPEARGRIWLTRVGGEPAVHFGGRRLDASPDSHEGMTQGPTT